MNTRIESDSLGQMQIEADSYSGIFTARAKENFQISGLRAYPSFVKALAFIKEAAAKVNAEAGLLTKNEAEAIQSAAIEFRASKFPFDLDIYQAGAGTSFNMNLNEILANRANEILGQALGSYTPLNPNDHINMGQSSNDVIPSALRIAALSDLSAVFASGNLLINSLEAKAQEFSHISKVGRTHLQDAVPMYLGQEFSAYASAIRNALARLESVSHEMEMLGIGGTAIGSGLNAFPGFSDAMCIELSKLTGLSLTPALNLFESTHSMAAFLSASSALRALAIEILRISNDLRLLSSGPNAGLQELQLPAVQAGSSIMPGKVNPSIAECMSMICLQVIGLDQSISLCSQQGQLELNWHTPLIQWNLLHQIEILGNGMKMFSEKCVKGIKANEENIKTVFDKSTVLATEMVPKLGYKVVAEMVKKSQESKRPFAEVLRDFPS